MLRLQLSFSSLSDPRLQWAVWESVELSVYARGTVLLVFVLHIVKLILLLTEVLLYHHSLPSETVDHLVFLLNSHKRPTCLGNKFLLSYTASLIAGSASQSTSENGSILPERKCLTHKRVTWCCIPLTRCEERPRE